MDNLPGGETMRRKTAMATIVFALWFGSSAWGQGPGFTQDDKERLLRVETILQVFMQQADKRSEEMRGDVDRRFQELRGDMNKRFEEIAKRFEQMMSFLWILVSIFTALTVAVIGFAYWDRRTIIGRAKAEAVGEMEREGKVRLLIEVMRAVAAKDSNVAEALRRFNLL
mgnify:CR=1 FL=1